jgi:zinc transporter, ZIP family
MAAAFGWGILAASSLVLGAVVALRFRISLRAIGLIMGFGSGVLISAVAFDLVEEAADMASGHGAVIAGIFAGCGVFFGGDWLIDRSGRATVRTPRAPRRVVPRSPSCSGPCSTGSPSRR